MTDNMIEALSGRGRERCATPREIVLPREEQFPAKTFTLQIAETQDFLGTSKESQRNFQVISKSESGIFRVRKGVNTSFFSVFTGQSAELIAHLIPTTLLSNASQFPRGK